MQGQALIMGILNVTPDSFSDGGNYINADFAVAHAKQMLLEGADIIDIGAMSTRPDSKPITVQEEIDRLCPVIDELVKIENVVISVDTVNPETAEFALKRGCNIINDVSGCFNPKMAEIVKKYSAGWVLTHTENVPSGSKVDYPDGVVSHVKRFFDGIVDRCDRCSIGKEHLCFDAGFGFAKTTWDNIELLKNLEKVIRDDIVFLTALSRKRFIGELTGVEKPHDRLAGTIAADIIALMKGSDIIRVHDVKEARQAVAIYNSIGENTIYG